MQDAPPGPRIWMDAFPLEHPLGTGITTYARGMAATLRGAGARLGLLYGRRIADREDPQEREVRFFDGRKPFRLALPGRILHTFHPCRARPIPASGLVARDLSSSAVYETFSTRNVEPAHEIWNARDMWGRGWYNLHVRRRPLAVTVREGRPPALMHWMQAQPLRLAGTRNVYTIHDLIPLRLPWAAFEDKGLWLKAVRAIARDADHVVTVSEHARGDIISHLGVPPERVTNTYQPVMAPPPIADGALAEARLRGVHGLEPRGFFLFVSTVEPRKNLARMLDAYYASGSATPFVIVGQKGVNWRDELRLLTEANGTRSPDGRVRYLGYVPRIEVDVLLRHARALLFCSLYEGFGLPVIEAMQVGTPVLTSTTSSLPEVAGPAALTVDPTDTRAIAEALRALDADAALRGRLSADGPGRAALFSPEAYAKRLAALHARLGVPIGEGSA